MSRSHCLQQPSGFIHVKDYYNSLNCSVSISPCSTTELYKLRKSLIKNNSNLSIHTAHLVLEYFQKYNSQLIQKEWEEIEAETQQELINDPTLHRKFQNDNSNSLRMFYLYDYLPYIQLYVIQPNPTVDSKNFWAYLWFQKVSKYIYIQKEDEILQNYWPEEGSCLYDEYEVSTVSIHLSSDFYTTRNFFIKNLLNSHTSSITQFHFTKWPKDLRQYQTSTRQDQTNFLRALLQFRREYKASYTCCGSPCIVQSLDGIDPSGVYVVLDTVLNRLINGVKQLDIRACVEHYRDQMPSTVNSALGYTIIFDAVCLEMLDISSSSSAASEYSSSSNPTITATEADDDVTGDHNYTPYEATD